MKSAKWAGLVAVGAMLSGGIVLAQGRGATGAPPPPDEKPSMEGASRAAEERPGTETTMSTSSATSDHAFAMDAARGGLAEVELGRIASQNAGDDSVKQFGLKMVDDHSKANDELKQIASSKGIALPSSVTSKDRRTADKLQKMNGASFDKAYMKDMVADHETDVAEFEREARSGKDPDLKAFAEKTLPTLKEHLQMARDAAAKVGAASSASKKTSSATNPSS
jgi:putative membrane protein